MFVFILVIFAVFLSVTYTTLNKLCAVFLIYHLINNCDDDNDDDDDKLHK